MNDIGTAATPGPGEDATVRRAWVFLDTTQGDVEASWRFWARAEALGARRVGGAIDDGVVLVRPPGGFRFCLTTWHGETGQVRHGLSSILDQACLDVPRPWWEQEIAFWSALTGWELRASDEPGCAVLVRPAGMPLRVLLQRLEEEAGSVRGHVDVACADRPAEVERHVAAGATVVDERSFWTVMRDPVGRVYCLTDRSPQQAPGR